MVYEQEFVFFLDGLSFMLSGDPMGTSGGPLQVNFCRRDEHFFKWVAFRSDEKSVSDSASCGGGSIFTFVASNRRESFANDPIVDSAIVQCFWNFKISQPHNSISSGA